MVQEHKWKPEVKTKRGRWEEKFSDKNTESGPKFGLFHSWAGSLLSLFRQFLFPPSTFLFHPSSAQEVR
jgi:hypothetical protein